MLSTGLYALLAGEATIAAIVGDRIEPIELSINQTMPALTYKFIGGSSEPTLDSDGWQRQRVEFRSFGDTHFPADALREALRRFLNGFQGTLSDGTVLQNVQLIQSQDGFEQYSREFGLLSEYYFYFTFPD
jgi:uncharacterized protein DUF3168